MDRTSRATIIISFALACAWCCGGAMAETGFTPPAGQWATAGEPGAVAFGGHAGPAVQPSEGIAAAAPPTWLIAGDANGDCKVDILDLMFIRSRLGRDTAAADNGQADLNEDGRINVLDLITARNKLGTHCIVQNPYKDVNWATFAQYKGNFHTHTESLTAAQVIDEYKSRGYRILAITDHDKITWPWTAYGRDAQALGMVAIKASELSCCDNIGSFFSDAVCGGSVPAALANVAAKNGLSIFNHPGRYSQTIEWYANYYRTYAHIVGFEVYNQGDRHPGDRQRWDELLAVVMPDRPVWGFANDDMHGIGELGYNCEVFPLGTLSEAEVRGAMVKGQFYFTHMTSTALPPPVIDSITVNEMAGTISIAGRNYTSIRWISNGVQVGTSATLKYLTTPNIGKYVRAELINSTATTCTNPFGIRQ